MKGKANVLIVYAHHNNQSFNAALLRVAIETLKETGCDVTVSDLYAMKYDPIIGRKDIQGDVSQHFNYSRAAAAAHTKDQLAPDMVREQQKVSKADLIIFQFPIQWSMVPAILKGWLERTFVGNFSSPILKTGGPIGYDQANFVGKRAVISMTTGATERYYSPEGRHGDINVMLYPLQNCVLQSNGFSVLKPQITYQMDTLDETARKQCLGEWRKRLYNIWTESPLPCIPNEEFGQDDVLKANSKYRKQIHAPSIGVHLGKPILNSRL